MQPLAAGDDGVRLQAVVRRIASFHVSDSHASECYSALAALADHERLVVTGRDLVNGLPRSWSVEAGELRLLL